MGSTDLVTDAFYRKLPEFIKELEDNKNPAVRYVLSMLQHRFVDDGTVIEWDLVCGLFDSYFKYLAGLVKGDGKKIVEILNAEVSNYLDDLLTENKSVRQQLNEYEAG